MCKHCEDIILRKHFYSQQDFLNCLDYIKELLEIGNFELIKSTCDLGSIRNENGQWASDDFRWTIRCKECGQNFTCYANTYRGGGGFVKE